MNHAGCRGVVARCEPWTLDRPWCVKVGGVREHQSEFGGHPISRSPAVYPPILSFCGGLLNIGRTRTRSGETTVGPVCGDGSVWSSSSLRCRFKVKSDRSDITQRSFMPADQHIGSGQQSRDAVMLVLSLIHI